MRYKFDVKGLVIEDLRGLDYKARSEKTEGAFLCEILGNSIYSRTEIPSMLNKAKEIFKGNEVEFNDDERCDFKMIINDLGYPLFMKSRIIDGVKVLNNDKA